MEISRELFTQLRELRRDAINSSVTYAKEFGLLTLQAQYEEAKYWKGRYEATRLIIERLETIIYSIKDVGV